MKVENQNVGNGMDGVMPIEPTSRRSPLKRSPHRDLVTHGGLGFDSRVHGRMNAVIGNLDPLAAMVFTDQIHPFVLIEREPFLRIGRIQRVVSHPRVDSLPESILIRQPSTQPTPEGITSERPMGLQSASGRNPEL